MGRWRLLFTNVTEVPQSQETPCPRSNLANRLHSSACKMLHFSEAPLSTFTKVILYTDTDGRAKFRQEEIVLSEGTPQSMLSKLLPSSGYQMRHSPVGFRSAFHCTTITQFVFILSGEMEIGLQDGTLRSFKPGEHFYSADLLPEGTAFDASIHGHWSRQVGNIPLVTLFVRG